MCRGDIALSERVISEAVANIKGEFKGAKLSASTFSFADLGCSFLTESAERHEDPDAENNYGQQRVVNSNKESVPEWGAERFFTNQGQGGGRRVNKPGDFTWKEGLEEDYENFMKMNSSSSSSSTSSAASS